MNDREDRINFLVGAGLVNLDLQPHRVTGRHPRLSAVDSVFEELPGRIDKHGNARWPAARSSRRSCSRFVANSVLKRYDTRQIAARPGETRDETELDRVFADQKNDGDRRGRSLGRQRQIRTSKCGDHSDRPADQFRRQRRQPSWLTLGPAVIDCDVLAFDISGLFEALAKSP